jgi:hypothetical protein
MSLQIAIQELCKQTIKSDSYGLAISVIQNISFAICTDTKNNVYQLPAFPAIYGVQGSGESMNSTACTTISRACNETCGKRTMGAVPFVSPQGKGCLGSCACVQSIGGTVVGTFWGKDILELPSAKNTKFESAGHHVAPLSLFLLGLSFLL